LAEPEPPAEPPAPIVVWAKAITALAARKVAAKTAQRTCLTIMMDAPVKALRSARRTGSTKANGALN
jgi:hypothetical protein